MDEVTSKLMHTLNLKQMRVPGLCVVFNVQIQPDLRELMETMNRMSNMPPDSEAKDKVSLWSVQEPFILKRIFMRAQYYFLILMGSRLTQDRPVIK